MTLPATPPIYRGPMKIKLTPQTLLKVQAACQAYSQQNGDQELELLAGALHHLAHLRDDEKPAAAQGLELSWRDDWPVFYWESSCALNQQLCDQARSQGKPNGQL